jgi:phenylacetate-coenzyme A ligase PaaK-like adenylate-forming protein
MDNFNEISNLNKKEILKIISKKEQNFGIYKKLFITTTSGTSGLKGIFAYDKNYIMKTIAFAKARLPIKINPIRAIFKPYKVAGLFSSSLLNTGTRAFTMGSNRFFQMNLFSLGDMEKIVDNLNKYQPDILSGYPSLIFNLTKYDKLNIKPTHIFTGGEYLDKKLRNQIEEKFNSKVYDVYGCAEAYPISCECEYQNHHLNEDFCIVEPKKDHILLTNLFSKIIPIIRYKIEDKIEIVNKKCKCGSELKVIKIKKGRIGQLFYFKKCGKEIFIHPFVFTNILDRNKEIIERQILQEGNNLIIKIVPVNLKNTKNLEEHIRRRINMIILSHKIQDFKLRIIFVDKINIKEKIKDIIIKN